MHDRPWVKYLDAWYCGTAVLMHQALTGFTSNQTDVKTVETTCVFPHQAIAGMAILAFWKRRE
jgi:hypothetical protein